MVAILTPQFTFEPKKEQVFFIPQFQSCSVVDGR
jgi:hypothetical protein